MAIQLGYEAWVKGDPKTKTLGDCKQQDGFPDFVTLFCCDSVFLFRAGPFCHRALLTLEEKHAKYTQDYVDFAEKPEWCVTGRLAALFALISSPSRTAQRVTAATHRTQTTHASRLLKVNPEGSVPVVKDRETEEWFVDSAKFVDYLEDKYPQPALGKSTDAPDA